MSVRMSVVVPAYNEAGYLEETLKSLQSQDFDGGYEVIVVDNNSTDGTAALARRFGVRVLHEPQAGVCAARQRGTQGARGDIVVSTDADTVHPPDWLSRIDATFRVNPGIVAVAGPCRYQQAPRWALVLPGLWFAAVTGTYQLFGPVFYVTATNIAFVRAGFPGYDTRIAQGGDEVELLRTLRPRGWVVWDHTNVVLTSPRRIKQGLAYTLLVSFGYHYASSYLVSKLSPGGEPRMAPAIRHSDDVLVGVRRRRWRAVSIVAGVGLVASAWTRARTR